MTPSTVAASSRSSSTLAVTWSSRTCVGRDVGEGGLELVGRLDPGEGAPRVRCASRTTVVKRSVASPVSSTTSSAVRSDSVPEHSGRKSQAWAFSRGRPSTGAGRYADAHGVDPGQQVGLALATLEAHAAQPLPRAVVALEELGVGERGPPQQRRAGSRGRRSTRRTSISSRSRPTSRSVHVLGQQQRHRARDPGGELELELPGAGGDADDDDLTGVDPGLDHAGGAVDDPPVELVPGQRGPRACPRCSITATSRARSRAWRSSRTSGDS